MPTTETIAPEQSLATDNVQDAKASSHDPSISQSTASEEHATEPYSRLLKQMIASHRQHAPRSRL